MRATISREATSGSSPPRRLTSIFEGHHSGGFHLSVHGPNGKFDGHRFHVRVDPRAVKKARAAGIFIEHEIGSGHSFDGVKLADNAFQVARLRWTWDLQRTRFSHAAQTRTPVPKLGPARDGAVLNTLLPPNSAWDVDIVVSYDTPYWPNAKSSARDSSRLGPLSNGSGMWLTGTSYHRSMTLSPTPEEVALPVPRSGQTPQFMLSAGPGPGGHQDMFWFVEGITSFELASATAASRGRVFDGQPRTATGADGN